MSPIKKIKARKVNKPRVTLRTKMIAPRSLNPIYRGVVPMLLQFNADLTELDGYTPETILQMIGTFMQGEHTHLILSKRKLARLRAYLKRHNIADWTRGDDGADADNRVAGDAGGGTSSGKRRQRHGSLSLRPVEAQKGD